MASWLDMAHAQADGVIGQLALAFFQQQRADAPPAVLRQHAHRGNPGDVFAVADIAGNKADHASVPSDAFKRTTFGKVSTPIRSRSGQASWGKHTFSSVAQGVQVAQVRSFDADGALHRA